MLIAPGDPGTLSRLTDTLARGGVVIMPCDTIYGIVGAAPSTGDRIRTIKGREENKPFLLLVADSTWVARLSAAEVPPGLARHWPGPLTVILPGLDGGTVAVRVPDSPFLRSVIEAVGSPLYSTSVNTAGQPALWRIADIVAGFEAEVDMVVDGGDLPGAAPSTIVDATGTPLRVVRKGALDIPQSDLD